MPASCPCAFIPSNMAMIRIFPVLLIALSTASTARGQAALSVTPAYAVVTQETPYGAFTLSNEGTEPVEITISARYGVIASSDSTTHVVLGEGGRLGNLADRLTFFPDRCILTPGNERIVRYLVDDASTVPHGGHIALMHFAMQERAVARQDQVPAVATALSIVYNLVTPLIYLSGQGAPDLDVQVLAARPGALDVMLRIRGVWPFLGGVIVKDGSKQLGRAEVAVYTERRLVIPLSGNVLPERLELHFDTRYTGLSHNVRQYLMAPEPISIAP